MLSLQIFAIAVIGFQDVLCLRKVYCEGNDEVCLTNALNERVFPKLLPGIPGVDPSEPLHLARLNIDLPNLKYSLLNATMTGVKDCVISFMKYPSDTQFEYKPCCPRLTIESQYEVEGKVDAVAVKGKGTFQITYEDFVMLITGDQKKVEFADCKQHIRILNYTTHLDLKGKSTYDYKNLVFGESGKCKSLEKEFCKPTDNECLTKAVREHIYQKVMKGMPGVASSDPLYLDKIVVDLPNLNYTLDHPTLLGLKNCDFLKLKLTPESGSVVYEVMCPHLIIKSKYEVKGEIDKITAEGKDNCELTYDNYFINITGSYERTKREDGKLHFHLIDFCVNLDNQAQTTAQYQNLSICGEGDADHYARKLEEETRDIVMKTILNRFINNLQDFQRIMPIEELHFRHV